MKGLLLALGALFAQTPNVFVNAKDLPTETLPAAPLVFIAYGFVWVAIFIYITTLWRRLGKVEHELHELAQKPRPAAR